MGIPTKMNFSILFVLILLSNSIEFVCSSCVKAFDNDCAKCVQAKGDVYEGPDHNCRICTKTDGSTQCIGYTEQLKIGGELGCMPNYKTTLADCGVSPTPSTPFQPPSNPTSKQQTTTTTTMNETNNPNIISSNNNNDDDKSTESTSIGTGIIILIAVATLIACALILIAIYLIISLYIKKKQSQNHVVLSTQMNHEYH